MNDNWHELAMDKEKRHEIPMYECMNLNVVYKEEEKRKFRFGCPFF